MSKKLFEIHIPYDKSYISLVLDSVTFLSEKEKLDKTIINEIMIALEETLTNVIKNGEDYNIGDTFIIGFYKMPNSIQIKILEKGLPFDPTLIPEFKTNQIFDKENFKGLGTYLINKLMDNVEYNNLGNKGKEIILTKYNKSKIIEEYIGINKELKINEKEFDNNKIVTIRKIELDEAVEVSQCAYFAYGYSYIYEALYYPETLRELNENNDMISMIAVSELNKIVGHAAILIDKKNKDSVEIGAGFVNPNFRGTGVLSKIVDELQNLTNSMNLYSIHINAVTSHIYSQKVANKRGFQATCLMLSRTNAVEFKEINSENERESVLLTYKIIDTNKSLKAYIPENHKDFIIKIYKNLGIEINSIDYFDEEFTFHNKSIIFTSIDNSNTAHIYIDTYGAEIVEQIEFELKRLCFKRVEVIYLYLPLNIYYTKRHSYDFEEMGFFISGILPNSYEKNYLVLQYLNNQTINYQNIQIFTDFGNFLKKYIKENDPNIRYLKS